MDSELIIGNILLKFLVLLSSSCGSLWRSMNDRLRMLASRYYSGVWVTSIDCLTLSWRAK